VYHAFQLYEPADAAKILERVKSLEFEDGRLTAGPLAVQRKKNRQVTKGEPLRKLRETLLQDMLRHPGLSGFALPRRFSLPIANLYGPGEEYGPHVDAARMAGLDGLPIRTDLSYTLFLSDPASYDGGALCFQIAGQQMKVRLDSGQMIVYPSTLIHSVEPVTRGERYCVVGWIESMVHDLEARNLLFRLDLFCQLIHGKLAGEPAIAEEGTAIYQGFLRALAR